MGAGLGARARPLLVEIEAATQRTPSAPPSNGPVGAFGACSAPVSEVLECWNEGTTLTAKPVLCSPQGASLECALCEPNSRATQWQTIDACRLRAGAGSDGLRAGLAAGDCSLHVHWLASVSAPAPTCSTPRAERLAVACEQRATAICVDTDEQLPTQACRCSDSAREECLSPDASSVLSTNSPPVCSASRAAPSRANGPRITPRKELLPQKDIRCEVTSGPIDPKLAVDATVPPGATPTNPSGAFTSTSTTSTPTTCTTSINTTCTTSSDAHPLPSRALAHSPPAGACGMLCAATRGMERLRAAGGHVCFCTLLATFCVGSLLLLARHSARRSFWHTLLAFFGRP